METTMTTTTGDANGSAVYACTSNWLQNVNVGACLPSSTIGYYQVLPHYYYPMSYSSPSRPIKLKLSEIERLRKAAKGDKHLKDILAKFTDLIEITVDFD